VLAATETPDLRMPNITDRYSWVIGRLSLSTRSRIINNRFASRSGKLWRMLQAATCEL
jgi:hypothetical protein